MPTFAEMFGDNYPGVGYNPEVTSRQPLAATPTPYEQEQSPTWEDHWTNLSAAAHNFNADMHQLSSQYVSDPALRKYHDAMAEHHRGAAQDLTEQLSPSARANAEAGFMSPQWRSHPFSSTLFAAEQQAPALAAAGLGEAAAGPPGAALAWAATSMGSAASAAAQAIDNMPDDQLQSKDSNYAAKRQSGMSEPDAKNSLKHERIEQSYLMPITGAVGAVAGAVGPLAQLGGVQDILGQASASIGKRMATGAAESGGVGAGQTAITNLALGQTTAGIQEPQSYGDIARESIQAGAGFGALGAFGGALHRRSDPTHPIAGRGRLDDDAIPGQASSSGSDRQGHKPEARSKPEPNVPNQPAGSTASPAPSLVDPAQQAALDANKPPTPRVKQSTKLTGEMQPPQVVAQPISRPPDPIATEPATTVAPTSQSLPAAGLPGKSPDLAGSAPPEPPTATPSAALPVQTENAPQTEPPPRSSSVPERPETVQLQLEALANGQKDIVVLPRGEGYSKSMATGGIKSAASPNGDMVLWKSKGKADDARVRGTIKEGQVNELQKDYGPVSQEEAQSRVAAGEQPVAVVERTSDGTEVKTAGGTDQTAAAQTQALEATKLAPEHTVTTEPVEKVLAERQAPVTEPTTKGGALKQKLEAKRALEESMGVGPSKGKRGEAATQKRLEGNALANDIAGKHQVSPEEIVSALQGEKGARNALLGKLRAALDEAKERKYDIPGAFRENVDATMNHSAAAGWLNEARLLVNRGHKEGSKAYQRFARRAEMLGKGEEGYKAWLEDRRKEVQEQKEGLGTETKETDRGEVTPEVTHAVSATEAPTTETDEETAYEHAHQAREAARMEARRRESEQLKKEYPTQKAETPKFAVEKVKRPASLLKKKIAKEREKIDFKPTVAMREAGNYQKGHIRISGHDISIESAKGKTRGEWRNKLPTDYGYIRGTVGKDGDHVDAYIGKHGDTGQVFVMNQLKNGIFDEHKVFMGYKSMADATRDYVLSFENPKTQWKNISGVVRMTPDEFKTWIENGDKFQPVHQGLEGEHPERVVETHAYDGTPTMTPYEGRSTIQQTLSQRIDYSNYPKSMQGIIKKLVDRIDSLVGDVPVYGITMEQMTKLDKADEQPMIGYYDRLQNHIILNLDAETDPLHTLVHEAFHAATIHAIEDDPQLADLAKRLHGEVEASIGSKKVPEELAYGRTSPVELLTELVSSPAWQKFAKSLPISKELAKDLDMPRWRRASVFQGALDWFRKLLGLSPREYNVIEAALNIGERAMWAKEPADEMAYRIRASQFKPDEWEGEGPVHAMRAPSSYSKDLKEMPDKFKSGLHDVMTRASDVIKEKGKRFQPLMDMVYGNEKFFGAANEKNPLRQLANRAVSMDGEREEIKKQYDPLLRAVQVYTRKNPNEAMDLHELLERSDHSNVHPDDPLGQGRNKGIKVNQTHIENSSMERWEAIRDHPELSKAYNELTPEGKKIFGGIRDMLTDINKKTIQASKDNVFSAAMEELNNSIERPDAAEFRRVLEKLRDEDALDEKEETTYGDDDTVKAIRAASAMYKRQGFYFPSKRFGNYAVTGTHDYDLPAGAIRDTEDPNRIIFSDRKSAFNFVRSLDLPSTVSHKADVHVTKGPLDEYHVVVNPKHVEFADNRVEGKKIADALRAAGVKDVTDPVLRGENQYLDYSLHAGQVKAFDKAVDRMAFITPETRQAAKEALHHMAVASLQGNRLSKNFLRKYRVAGADSDILRTLDSYRNSSATFLSGAKYLPQIKGLLDRVDGLAKQAEKANDSHAYDMSIVTREMERRLLGFKQGSYGELSKSLFHNVAALALWKYLFSPAHFALHLMHPVITSIPEMAGEHGFWPTYRTMMQTYRDMGAGSTMVEGGKGFWKKAWDFERNPTDFIDSLKTRLKESGRDRATIDMLGQLEHDGYLTHMGLDFSPFYQKSGGLTYLADRSLGMMQELNNSAESINRVGTAVSAFDLARSKGLSDEEATGYVRRVLSQTHGLYANVNRAPMMMSHPVIRSMLQFKTFPMMIYRILARNVYNIVKGDSPEARWQAVKALTGMVGTAALFTGAQGATPEPVRLGITLTNLLGLTDNWEQEQDKLRRTLAEEVTPEVAGAVMGGLGHMIGWDLHHRLGINDLTVFSEPKTTSPGDVENWMVNAIAGVPWGMGVDAYTGYQSLLNGDYGKAVNLLLPKALADLNKAYQLGSEGKTTSKGTLLVPQVSKMGLLGQALGFVPSEVSEAQQARAAYGADLAEQRNEKQQIAKLWQSGQKMQALRLLQEYNRQHPTDRMTVPKLKQTQTILGYPTSPKNQKDLKERARAYGIQ